jgi:parallel beta-helix repeat protein
VTLDLGAAQLTPSGAVPYMLRVEHAVNVTVLGGDFSGGDSAVLVSFADGARVQEVTARGLSGDGIVITNSKNVLALRNTVTGCGGAGILLHRSSGSVIARNEIDGGKGHANLEAGIVITDREVDLAANPRAVFGPDGYWVVEQPITTRLKPPHDNAIALNRVAFNAAGGIYVDGGVRNAILSNTIEGNAKEGLCLDNGSAANAVAYNTIRHNGKRWGEPDWVLAKDYVLAGGRLADGTPAEKVPGISLDNAIYNVIFANDVMHNYGGGIKIVRTGYFNSIGMNTVWSNNDGAGPVYHFFGIELGAASPDEQSPELDFTPSRGNLVFSNPIRGNHHSGIFFAAGSDRNDVFDNVIFDALYWALESYEPMENASLNNLTNLPSRNIASGLDPALAGPQQPPATPVTGSPPATAARAPARAYRPAQVPKPGKRAPHSIRLAAAPELPSPQ